MLISTDRPEEAVFFVVDKIISATAEHGLEISESDFYIPRRHFTDRLKRSGSQIRITFERFGRKTSQALLNTVEGLLVEEIEPSELNIIPILQLMKNHADQQDDPDLSQGISEAITRLELENESN